MSSVFKASPASALVTSGTVLWSKVQTVSRYAGSGLGFAVVDGRAAAEDQVLGRHVGDNLAVPVDLDAPVAGDLADVDGVQVPLVEDGLDLDSRPRSTTISIRSWLSESSSS